jgi:5-methylcytosine-specific restriction endonuclease McrA
MSLREKVNDVVKQGKLDQSAYLRGKTKRSVEPSSSDLPTLLREKNLAIAKIDRQASEAKSAIEREYKAAVLKITNDLKQAHAEIMRTEKLKNKKPSVTRTQAKSKVRSEKMTSKNLSDRLKLFDGCCAYCSESLGKNKQIDHVVPISKLGADTLDNIVFVCQSCNLSKGNRNFLDWYRTKPFWTQARESKVLSVTGKLDALKV